MLFSEQIVPFTECVVVQIVQEIVLHFSNFFVIFFPTLILIHECIDLKSRF